MPVGLSQVFLQRVKHRMPYIVTGSSTVKGRRGYGAIPCTELGEKFNCTASGAPQLQTAESELEPHKR